MYYFKKLRISTAELVAVLLLVLMPALSAHAAFVDYQRTVVVSAVGPTAVANGAALIAGLSSITGGFPAPSSTDRYLLKLEPGIYDVGVTSLQIPSYVDIEGSGEGVTLVRGIAENAFSAGTGVISVSENSAVRHLSVENNVDSNLADSAALILEGGSQAHHVTATATGNFDLNRALLVWDTIGTTVAKGSNLTVNAAARAVHVFFPGFEAENVVANGAQALFVSSGNVFIRNSRFIGSDFSMLVANLSETVDLVTTQLAGDVSCTSNNCRCFHSYDANLRKLRRRCRTRN